MQRQQRNASAAAGGQAALKEGEAVEKNDLAKSNGKQEYGDVQNEIVLSKHKRLGIEQLLDQKRCGQERKSSCTPIVIIRIAKRQDPAAGPNKPRPKGDLHMLPG